MVEFHICSCFLKLILRELCGLGFWVIRECFQLAPAVKVHGYVCVFESGDLGFHPKVEQNDITSLCLLV